MDIGCNEPITGSEKELYEGKKGKRLIFSAPSSNNLPNCPQCGHNRKVFKAAGQFVCSEFHTLTPLGTPVTQPAKNDWDTIRDIHLQANNLK